jgi:hypothetical protein
MPGVHPESSGTRPPRAVVDERYDYKGSYDAAACGTPRPQFQQPLGRAALSIRGSSRTHQTAFGRNSRSVPLAGPGFSGAVLHIPGRSPRHHRLALRNGVR